MLRKIYLELVAIKEELQNIRSVLEFHSVKFNTREFSQFVQKATHDNASAVERFEEKPGC